MLEDFFDVERQGESREYIKAMPVWMNTRVVGIG